MVIALFKENQPLGYILAIILGVIFWFPSFLSSTTYNIYVNMPLQDAIFKNYITHPFTFKLIAFLTLILTGFILNFIVNKFDLFSKQNNLTFLLYITFMSVSKTFVHFYAHITCNLLLVIALYKILQIYRTENAYAHVFDASFLIGLASLFYLPSIGLLILIFFSLIIFHTFNWREWVLSLFGISCVFTLFFAYYFINNNLSILFSEQLKNVVIFPYEFQENTKLIWVQIVVLIGIASLALIKTFDGMGFYNIRSRQSLTVVLWMAFISFGVAFIIPTWTFLDFALFGIPFSIIIANYFMNIKKAWMADTLFFVLVLCTIIVQYNLI